eukprot:gene23383-35824_t
MAKPVFRAVDTGLAVLMQPPEPRFQDKFGSMFSQPSGQSIIHYMHPVYKISSKGKRQSRMLLVSNKAIYLTQMDAFVKRCVPIRDVEQILLVPGSCCIGLRVPTQYDVLFEIAADSKSMNAPAEIHYLLNILKVIYQKENGFSPAAVEKWVVEVMGVKKKAKDFDPPLSMARPKGFKLTSLSIPTIPASDVARLVQLQQPQSRPPLPDIAPLLPSPRLDRRENSPPPPPTLPPTPSREQPDPRRVEEEHPLLVKNSSIEPSSARRSRTHASPTLSSRQPSPTILHTPRLSRPDTVELATQYETPAGSPQLPPSSSYQRRLSSLPNREPTPQLQRAQSPVQAAAASPIVSPAQSRPGAGTRPPHKQHHHAPLPPAVGEPLPEDDDFIGVSVSPDGHSAAGGETPSYARNPQAASKHFYNDAAASQAAQPRPAYSHQLLPAGSALSPTGGLNIPPGLTSSDVALLTPSEEYYTRQRTAQTTSKQGLGAAAISHMNAIAAATVANAPLPPGYAHAPMQSTAVALGLPPPPGVSASEVPLRPPVPPPGVGYDSILSGGSSFLHHPPVSVQDPDAGGFPAGGSSAVTKLEQDVLSLQLEIQKMSMEKDAEIAALRRQVSHHEGGGGAAHGRMGAQLQELRRNHTQGQSELHRILSQIPGGDLLAPSPGVPLRSGLGAASPGGAGGHRRRQHSPQGGPGTPRVTSPAAHDVSEPSPAGGHPSQALEASDGLAALGDDEMYRRLTQAQVASIEHRRKQIEEAQQEVKNMVACGRYAENSLEIVELQRQLDALIKDLAYEAKGYELGLLLDAESGKEAEDPAEDPFRYPSEPRDDPENFNSRFYSQPPQHAAGYAQAYNLYPRYPSQPPSGQGHALRPLNANTHPRGRATRRSTSGGSMKSGHASSRGVAGGYPPNLEAMYKQYYDQYYSKSPGGGKSAGGPRRRTPSPRGSAVPRRQVSGGSPGESAIRSWVDATVSPYDGPPHAGGHPAGRPQRGSTPTHMRRSTSRHTTPTLTRTVSPHLTRGP